MKILASTYSTEKLPADLVGAVSKYEIDLAKILFDSTRLAHQGAMARLESRVIYSTMGVLDRHLNGILGANMEKARKHKLKSNLAEKLAVERDGLLQSAKMLEEKIIQIIGEHLCQHDERYQKLVIRMDRATEARGEISRFLKIIDRAISDLDDASTSNAMDMFSGDKFFSVMSFINTRSARKATRRVKDSLPEFIEYISLYLDAASNFGSAEPELQSSEVANLALDLTLGDLSFHSLVTAVKVAESRFNLTELREGVEKLGDEIDRKMLALNLIRGRHIEHIRRLCC
ncbi:MAG: hypothetical protein M0P11_10210 [Anaerolineaceae bacterium]|nr:hypothetical protein [Anaerolineaceae bacterium]